MRIFISHSGEEKAIATYLASWLEKIFSNTQCFCSSRPQDLSPSTNWFGKIVSEARISDLCLLLISPFSYDNNWIIFEAGLAWGNTKIQGKVVPTLFGGLKVDHIFSALRTVQCLQLEEEKSFNSFLDNHILSEDNPSHFDTEKTHRGFTSCMPQGARTLLKYGTFGLIPDDLNVNIQIFKQSKSLFFNDSDDNKQEETPIAAKTIAGRVVAVRARIIPRRTKAIIHWKFGITLVEVDEKPDGTGKLLKFHAGRDRGEDTWTLYFGREKYPLNVQTKLEPEKICELQILLSPDGWNAQCIGVDSTGKYTVLKNDNEPAWRLEHNRWSHIYLHSWGDGAPYQVDLIGFEVSRVKLGGSSNISV
ncbi:MAG: toll/interleukin-1 receptor domain-containing protein [Nitrospinales bacterium]